jgi:hypothetical protein
MVQGWTVWYSCEWHTTALGCVTLHDSVWHITNNSYSLDDSRDRPTRYSESDDSSDSPSAIIDFFVGNSPCFVKKLSKKS